MGRGINASRPEPKKVLNFLGGLVFIVMVSSELGSLSCWATWHGAAADSTEFTDWWNFLEHLLFLVYVGDWQP